VTSPTVSILMTAYNRGKYIAEAIESVLASSFEDFELIIVDDCSIDSTVEVARRYLSDPRVQVHVNETNLGDYPNRNRAAELARGKYLKYVDSDDMIYPHCLEVMVNVMEQHPAAAVGFSLSQDRNRLYPFQLSPAEAFRAHFGGEGPPLFHKSPLGVILRKETFLSLGGFVANQGPRGDFATWLQIALRHPVVIMPDGLAWWRTHPQQESKYRVQIQAEDIYQSYLLALAALNNLNCPLPLNEQRELITRLKQAHRQVILRLLIRGPRMVAWRVIRKHWSARTRERLDPYRVSGFSGSA
jgi:glycosyltransferase involved in cell wall biosynthesis